MTPIAKILEQLLPAQQAEPEAECQTRVRGGDDRVGPVD